MKLKNEKILLKYGSPIINILIFIYNLWVYKYNMDLVTSLGMTYPSWTVIIPNLIINFILMTIIGYIIIYVLIYLIHWIKGDEKKWLKQIMH